MSDSWEVPAPRGIPRAAFRRQDMGVVDYTLAKRALLREFRRGLTSQLEICDAHPELLRAAKNLGTDATRPCPVCNKEELRLLAYVYADGAGRDNGRAWRVEDGLSIAAAHTNSMCYVVEVCVGCCWNHLTEAFQARSVG
ncbi:MAG: DUF5318 family protein [Actinomycetota bacterium]